MRLPTEAVSAYILCCSLADQGVSISIRNILEIWTGSEDSLRESLEMLEARQILEPLLSVENGGRVYRLSDHEWWRGGH